MFINKHKYRLTYISFVVSNLNIIFQKHFECMCLVYFGPLKSNFIIINN
jgi:hypothetical protein